jgi:hypothetical protein
MRLDPLLVTPDDLLCGGEVEQYEASHRLCYIRGPEGIIVALAEHLS